jgi:FAD/FMN-containing dehydrogenase
MTPMGSGGTAAAPPRAAELWGWGRRPRARAEAAELPGQSAVAAHLSAPYLARGLGRSYGDAGLPAPDHRALATRRLDRILSFNPFSGVLDAEAGVPLSAILAVAVPRGFFLPVTPGTMAVSLGGALASNVHGKNHHRSGSIENFVLEAEVATPLGNFLCSATERADLFRAAVGGYGLTGLIVRAKLQLKPIDTAQVDALRLRAADLDSLFALMSRHDAEFEYSVAWLDTLARGRGLGRGVLMLGNHAEPSGRGKAADLAHRARRAVPVPFDMPGFLLNRPALSAFNGMFYRFSRAGRAREGFDVFFYPLDRISDWNRLYGKAGFFQYQCVIPDPQGEAGVKAALEFLAGAGLGAFLSVLKRCGDDHALIPFCRKGYTLALDVPFRGPATLKALDRLDELVIRFGGRVYLTKDARLSPEAFRAMYPEAPAFMEAVRRYNPVAHCDSRMARRLGLWDL